MATEPENVTEWTQEDTSPIVVTEEATEEVTEEVTEADTLVRPSIRTTYALGDILDADTLGLYAVYESGKEEPIYSGFACSPETLDQPGTQTVTVTYGGITKSFDVEVLGFYELEATLGAYSDTTYNSDRKVYCVLRIDDYYNGNPADFSCEYNIENENGFTGDWYTSWLSTVDGKSGTWGY